METSTKPRQHSLSLSPDAHGANHFNEAGLGQSIQDVVAPVVHQFAQAGIEYVMYPGLRDRAPQAEVWAEYTSGTKRFSALGYSAEKLQFGSPQQTAYLILPLSASKLRRVWTMIGGNGMIATDLLSFVHDYAKAHTGRRGEGTVGFLLVDFPGYNESQGQPSPDAALYWHQHALTNMESALATKGAITKGPNRVKYGVFGHSLGCAAMSQLAAQFNTGGIDTVILSAPFISAAAFLHSKIKTLNVQCSNVQCANMLAAHPWDNARAIENMPRDTKLTIIHGQADSLIPVSDGEHLAKLAQSRGIKTDFINPPDADHNDILTTHQHIYFQQMDKADH